MKRASASARSWRAKRRSTADMVIPVPDSGVPAALGYADGVRIALRARHHPQPLCRAHLHRAVRPHPPSRRAAEAQSQPRHAQGQARGAGGRFHRARHDVEEDRGDGARRGRRGSAFPRRQPADHAFLLLWRRHAQHRRSARAQAWMSKACAASSAPTAWPSSRWTVSIAPWARPSAMPTAPQFCDACFSGDYPIELTDLTGGGKDAPALAARRRRLNAMTEEPSRWAHRARHRRVARHRARGGASRWPQRARMSICVARTVGGLEEAGRRDPEGRAAAATLVPLESAGFRRHRPAGRIDLRALGQARRVSRQCRRRSAC